MSEPVSSSAVVSILLDGSPHTVPSGQSLAGLVESLGHAADATATAVNGDFVPRSRRAAWTLQPGDAVLLFQPIVGG